MKSRLYLETTIPSYLTSRPSRDLIIASHQQITREWWKKRRDTFHLYISQLVVDEASAGDPVAARERLKVVQDLPLMDITPEPRWRNWRLEFWPPVKSLAKLPPTLRIPPSQQPYMGWISW